MNNDASQHYVITILLWYSQSKRSPTITPGR